MSPDSDSPSPFVRHRRILHVDMDAFFAAVEQRDDPSLRGQPVAVGGSPDKRGVVAAASYEARAFGVRSAMPMSRAVRLCPALVIVRPDIAKYRAVSKQVFDLFRAVTPLVEPLSLDEAYLDVTDNAWGEPLGMRVAQRLKEAIHATTSLTASAGVASNKFLAKIASGWQKPDGLTVIAPERVETFLKGLPVDALWGVGPVTARKLKAQGIERVVDVRAADPEALRRTVGSLADWLCQLAQGIDPRPVVAGHEPKSAGSENTFEHDLTDLEEIRREVDGMARHSAAWLVRRELYAKTVTIKVRYDDFSTVTRSHTALPTRDEAAIVARARELLTRTEAAFRPVRLLGVSVHGLSTTTDVSRARRSDEHGSLMLPFDEPGHGGEVTVGDNRRMLTGSRAAVIHKLQPVSIHGQLSYDLHYIFQDEPDSQVRVARVGPEAMTPTIQAGDRVSLDFVIGVVTGVRRIA
jgi:DNA polymerase-4